MRTVLKRTISIIVTAALILFGINVLSYIVRPVDTDRSYRRIYAFHDLPEDSIEVIVYGSSHAFLGIHTNELYNKYGIGAYNYGTNWERLNTTKLFIQDSFETQTPKLAIIETYNIGRVLTDTDMTGEIFYTRYFDNTSYKFDYLKQCFGRDLGRWLSYIMPLCTFHDNWTAVSQASFKPLLSSSKMDSVESIKSNMGFAPYDTVTEVEMKDAGSVKQLSLKADAVAELDSILTLCRKNGTEVMFVTVPYATGHPYADAVREYSDANGCAYINMFDHMDEIGFDPKTDFKDKGHLNSSGAAKVSDYIGKYIVEHYDLTDMRTIKDNLWQREE